MKYKICVVCLTTEAERLYDIRRNRLNSLKENEASDYTNLDKIRDEVNNSKKLFKKNKWPIIDVTRKSVEETAASIIKIFEIPLVHYPQLIARRRIVVFLCHSLSTILGRVLHI